MLFVLILLIFCTQEMMARHYERLLTEGSSGKLSKIKVVEAEDGSGVGAAAVAATA